MPPTVPTPWHDVDMDTALAEIVELAQAIRRAPVIHERFFSADIDPVWPVRRALHNLRTIHARTNPRGDT